MAYKNNDIGHDGKHTYTGRDGSTYELDLSTSDDAYYADNLFRKGKVKHLDAAIQYYLEYGVAPTKSDLEEYGGFTMTEKQWSNINKDFNTFLTKNKLEDYTLPSTGDPQTDSFNAYWNNLTSTDPGTLGGDILNNFTEAEQNIALSNLQLADAQYQQAAMQQAQTVKDITDQVRAERMARLRAGMSESQIANQDMQIMLNNMNALNQQANTMNYNRLTAQQQYNLAQDTAYQQYINTITNLGSTAAAMAASDAGDAYMNALKLKNNPNLAPQWGKVTGQNQ